MERVYPHGFAVGQRWKNDSYVIYVMAVDDDYLDNAGKLCAGLIAVTTERPFPGRDFIPSHLAPVNMIEVIMKGGYVLMDEGWDAEFRAEKQAMLDAQAAAGHKEPDPPRPPPMVGVGFK